jgi:HEAT repeat protein
MNIVLDRLRAGDLRTDGEANEVVRDVLAHRGFFELLWEGLSAEEDALRGHTADALEKVSRAEPEWYLPLIPSIIEKALRDPVAMVRWHLAMILGTLGALGHQTEDVVAALLELLCDRSAFVKSWSIASLALIGREHPELCVEIIPQVVSLLNDRSIAVRVRADKALAALEGRAEMPAGWVKCEALQQ